MEKTALFFKICNSFGGSERRLIRAFSRLYRNDEQHNVQILILESGTTEASEEQIKKWTDAGSDAVFFTSFNDLIQYMKAQQFTWVCAASPSYTTVRLFLMAKLMKTKTLFFSVESYSSRLIFSDAGNKRRFLLCCKFANAIDVLYPQAIDVMKKRFPKKQVTLTPGAFVDYERFVPGEKENLIVFSARLVKGKNAEVFIDAALLQKDLLRKTGYTCAVCGEGPLKEALEKTVREASAEDLIRFTGYVDTAAVLQKAKVFCSLQSVTNYPSQALIEALACGCVCVVTNTGESSMMLGNDCGYLTDVTAESIADGIKKAVELSDEAFNKKSAAAREHAMSHFTLESTLEHFEKILY